MAELELAAFIAKLIQNYGVNVALTALFIGYLFWSERQRNKNAQADRQVLTNHLSVMIKEDTDSREKLAIGLTI